jgi:hypothetical protein
MERWTKWLLRTAGVYGLIVLAPFYFLEEWIGSDQPPPITHPEDFYGFLGVAVAWQAAVLIMSRDPLRFHPLLPACVLEKAGFGIAAIVLFVQGRLATSTLAAGLIDLILGALFVAAYLRLQPRAA